ncbi:hypothetical protein N7478_008439 [Penicillium angulare]|uniref:uncharacterized protein n=1 Tax=Penicillium angulare TaxID=116970 RepID=UPI00254244E4|nr:uncharacterized protein N7478_008439 [Penicillium angulare]KAJ5273314.1 hypothetical protein N7478_008439 [Penicillium angulare]
MTAAGVSPSSSPRLPSPPPFTEVQIGPQSPSVGETFGKDGEQLLGAPAGEEDGSTRRIRPGTKTADMAFGPPLIPLSQLDSPFQLQEHLKALYHHFTKPEGSDTVIPISREVAIQLAEPPEGVDRSLWLYELCRFLTMKVNNLIIAFFAESPPCSSQTCPEMRASEWQYLCAVHDPPKSCCAIDYCCHTLDWATNTLTSPKHFPSRLTLGSEAGGGPSTSIRHLTNIFRRLYRIFAHAWFQHRDVFWEVEGHDGLYVFFKTVCDMFQLIPEDNYTIPPEAEGLDAVQPRAVEEQQQQQLAESKRLTILRKDEGPFAGGGGGGGVEAMDPSISTGATTRRHKHSPSTGSRVTTITESAEDPEEVHEIQAPLRDVMTESHEPFPSVIENDSSTPLPETEAAPANEEITETSEPPSEAQEQELEQAEKEKESEKEQEQEQEQEQPQEAAESPIEPKEEAAEQPEANEAEPKTESSAESPLEGEDASAPPAAEEAKEPEAAVPESEAGSEPEPKPKSEAD